MVSLERDRAFQSLKNPELIENHAAVLGDVSQSDLTAIGPERSVTDWTVFYQNNLRKVYTRTLSIRFRGNSGN
jgi:hypothetical protein